MTFPTATWTLPARIGLLVVIAFFGLPLFVNLGAPDLRNDEAIYAYAVDRIVETGEWLTPRSIQVNGPFLEKPPLKFWLTAGLMRLGVIPQNDGGMRFLDALFGVGAFAYVYLLGLRFGGTVAGIASVLLLFTLDRFLFDHGLRSNNMEAALVLSYCGGVYHFARWYERNTGASAWPDAFAVAAYFVLGFMTKFVAALFLPIVCGAAFLVGPQPIRRLRESWKTWLAAAAVAIAAIAPWFVYETVLYGRHFWDVIVGEHIYTRFTASLDPHHLHPWFFYYVETWKELAGDGSQWIGAAGLTGLAIAAVARGSWLARLVFLWWALPFALISMGSSKLIHYAYPFFPPMAIGAGYVSALIVALSSRAILLAVGAPMRPLVARVRLMGSVPAVPSWARYVFAGVAFLAFGIAVATLVNGDLSWTVGGVRIFRNSSVIRPMMLGATFVWLSGWRDAPVQALALLPLLAVLPLNDYHRTLERMDTAKHPLRSLRECALEVQKSGVPVGKGVYNAAPSLSYHSYYYYLHPLGPFTEVQHPDPDELVNRLVVPDRRTPVLLSIDDYDALLPRLARFNTPGGLAAFSVALEERLVVLLPGPYNACVDAAVSAGGEIFDASDLTSLMPLPPEHGMLRQQ